jgi:hypothetical protein
MPVARPSTPHSTGSSPPVERRYDADPPAGLDVTIASFLISVIVEGSRLIFVYREDGYGDGLPLVASSQQVVGTRGYESSRMPAGPRGYTKPEPST